MEIQKYYKEKHSRVVIMLSVVIISIIGANACPDLYKAYFILIAIPVIMFFTYKFFEVAYFNKKSNDLIGFIVFTSIIEIGLGYMLFS